MHNFLIWLKENQALIFTATLEHLRLSLLALLVATVLAVPLALWLAYKRRWAEGALALTNILQTLPSLALLGLLIPLVGIGTTPMLIALTLYALLPIFQNTCLGLQQIDPALREAHTAFGLSRVQALWRIELPLALPAMIAGIRSAAVLIVGTATLAALIGAGGLGTLILLGIDRNNMMMTFTGAALSALLAVLVSAAIGVLQRARHKGKIALLLALAIAALFAPALMNGSKPVRLVIAGKLGSEPEILINLYRLVIEKENPQLTIALKPNFGKSGFLFNALKSGEIDLYPEFTGTVLETFLTPAPQTQALSREETYALARSGLLTQHQLAYLAPMDYENTYALAVPAAFAREHELTKISQLKALSTSLRAGFTLEFTDRNDGYQGLQARGIHFSHLATLEPALRYRAISEGQIDLIDAYSTDSELVHYQLTTLEDDLALFPHYHTTPLMRQDYAAAHPEITQALNQLAGKISAADMQRMNAQVKFAGQSAAEVAENYLREQGIIP